MDNNYNNDHNYSGGTEPEPQYGSHHSFNGNTSTQYDAQSVGSYDPQQGAPNYGGAPMNGGYGYPNGQPYSAPDFYSQLNTPYAKSVPDGSSGRGIAALVLGIISWLVWCVPVLGLCTSIIGLILGIQGRNGEKKGLAIAGIVLSSISGVAGVFYNIAFVIRIIQEASGI